MNKHSNDLQQAGSSMKVMGVLMMIFGILALAPPWNAGRTGWKGLAYF